jgi:hypothetical protein
LPDAPHAEPLESSEQPWPDTPAATGQSRGLCFSDPSGYHPGIPKAPRAHPSAPWLRLVAGTIVTAAPAAAVLAWCLLRLRGLEIGNFSTAPGWLLAAGIVAAVVLPMFTLGTILMPFLRQTPQSRPAPAFDSTGKAVAALCWALHGAVILILSQRGNALFDASEERSTVATVRSRHLAGGKSRYFVWVLEGDFHTRSEIVVPEFDLPGGPPVVVGTRLDVRFHEGAAGYPWGTIRRAP